MKDKKINYENEKKNKISSVEYIYAISFNHNGNKHTVEYIETVSKDKPSKLELYSSLPVFLDINRNLAKNIKDMKSQMWQWPLGFAFCTAMLIVCMVVVALLNN